MSSPFKSSYLPPGCLESDPNAPWNQPEADPNDCEVCGQREGELIHPELGLICCTGEGMKRWRLFCGAVGGSPTGHWIVAPPIGALRYFSSFEEARRWCMTMLRFEEIAKLENTRLARGSR